MKVCPKCGIEFEPVIKDGYEPKFCSRSCANSRKWSDADKLKKSESGRTSLKVKKAAATEESKAKKSAAAKKQHADGLIKPLTKEARDRGRIKAIEVRRSRIDSLDSSNKANYRKQCRFRFNMKDYPTEFDFSLIEKYGLYSATNKGNNVAGVSRDHMLSISDGWKLGIDPLKIRHPANCRLVPHKENWDKRAKSIINEEELDYLIRLWDEKWAG